MIIDSHVHIFPEKIALKAVENIGSFYNLNMEYNGLVSQLTQIMKTNNVDKAIVCSTATAKHQVNVINNFIYDTVKLHPDLYGLITLHQNLTEEEMVAEIANAKQRGLIGIKLHPDFQKFYIDDPIMYDTYRMAEENNLPILFHAGDSRYDYSSPIRLAKVAGEFPKLTCIAAHMGGYERWEQAEVYRKTDNVYFDTSSSFVKLPAERFLELFQIYGTERFMWGSDFPMWNMKSELEKLIALVKDSETLQKMLCGNVARIYGLNIDGDERLKKIGL